MKNIWIVIPTYDEEENIKEVIESIYSNAPAVSLLIVDDNSPDNTQMIVKELQKKYPGLHLMVREGKTKGYAPSLLDGFCYALELGAEAVFQMDADMSHHPRYLPKLIEKLSEADVVCGSRWAKGGGVENWPLHRETMSRCASIYARMLLSMNIRDCTAGWIGYKRWVLEKIDLGKIKADGYGFNTEIKYRAKCLGAKFTEVPIVFKDRRFGNSKLSKKIIWEAIWVPWKLLFKKV